MKKNLSKKPCSFKNVNFAIHSFLEDLSGNFAYDYTVKVNIK